MPLFLIGKTFSISVLSEQKGEIKDVTLNCEELECFVTNSKPNGSTNLAFPNDIRMGA